MSKKMAAISNSYPGRGTMPFRPAPPMFPPQLLTPPRPPERSFLVKPIFDNAYLLFPSVLGTGIAYLMSLTSESAQNTYDDYPKSIEQGTFQDFPSEPYVDGVAKLVMLTYVVGSVCGIAVFIYRSVTGSPMKYPLSTLLPIGIGLTSAISLFASVNLAMFILFPTSFTGQVGKHWIDKVISFVYYSTLGISVGPVGDIVPTENTTRILLAMEGIINLVIFSLLIALIFSRQK